MYVRPNLTPVRTGLIAALVAIFSIAVLIPAGSAQAAKPAKAKLKLQLKNVKKGQATVMNKVTIKGTLVPFRNLQKVTVRLYRDGKLFSKRKVKVERAGKNHGTFKTEVRMRTGNRYGVWAKYWGKAGKRAVSKASSGLKNWRVRYVGLAHRQCGKVVTAFRRALNRMALVPGGGRCFRGKMSRAVLAYRKLNNLPRNSRASKLIVRRVFNGKGGYHVRRPGLGRHVESPLSRQVLVFAKGRKPYAIFPIASGKSSTPTILGTYRFYRKDPGYNSIGMYYSSYFYGGYAIHGYKSVPDYPASHGCLRTFISDQPRIYRMTRIGMPIYTFGNAFRGKASYQVKESGPGLGPDLGPAGGLDPGA